MQIFQKILSLIIVMLTCTLSTGFSHEGEERPEDCIRAVLTAIESNNAEEFSARVLKEYWLSRKDYFTTLTTPDIATWAKALTAYTNKTKLQDKISELNKTSKVEDVQNSIIFALRNSVNAAISKGEFASICRKGAHTFLPFSPENLRTFQITELGSGKYAGITTASLDMPHNQRSVLGLAQIEKKWYIVSNAGNQKAAMDKALIARTAMLEKAEKIAARKRSNMLYIKRVEPYAHKVQSLLREEKWEELVDFHIKTMGLLGEKDRAPITAGKNILNPVDLWKKVGAGIELELSIDTTSKKLRESRMGIVKSAFYAYFWNNFNTINTSEILWENNTIMVVRESGLVGGSSAEKRRAFYTNWLNDDIAMFDRFTTYRIEQKNGAFWETKARSVQVFDSFSTTARIKIYYPFVEDRFNIRLNQYSLEDYMIELAKRYEYLQYKANIALESKKTLNKETK